MVEMAIFKTVKFPFCISQVVKKLGSELGLEPQVCIFTNTNYFSYFISPYFKFLISGHNNIWHHFTVGPITVIIIPHLVQFKMSHLTWTVHGISSAAQNIRCRDKVIDWVLQKQESEEQSYNTIVRWKRRQQRNDLLNKSERWLDIHI